MCLIPEVSSKRGSDGIEFTLHFAQFLSHTDHNTSQRASIFFWHLTNIEFDKLSNSEIKPPMLSMQNLYCIFIYLNLPLSQPSW